MRKGVQPKGFLVVGFGIAAALSGVGGFPTAHSQQSQPLRPIRDLKVTDIFLPNELGEVAAVREATPARGPTRSIVLIQDAHVNYAGQKNLATMLDRFAEAYGLHLILVEGGEGDASLSYLRSWAPKAVREQVAERFLQEGLLSGEEYLDLVSDHPLILWGVDDQALYDAHVERFMEIERVRNTVEGELGHLRQLLDAVRAKDPNRELDQLQAQQALFESGKLDLGAYVQVVVDVSERAGVALVDYPHLWRFVTAAHLEPDIDLDRVAEEQRALMRRLKGHATQEELAHLTSTALELKAGKVQPTTFYAALERLAKAYHADVDPDSHLGRYIRYTAIKDQVDPPTLWAELGQARQAIAARLARSSTEAQLVTIAEALELSTRLISVQWTPHDYETYLKRQDLRVQAWLPWLKEHAERLSLAIPAQVDGARLDLTLASATRFYQAAAARDQAMVERALKKMEEVGVSAAVLIAGGFHTAHLSELLAARGVSTMVITPQADQVSDDARYRQALRYKNGLPSDRRAIRVNRAPQPAMPSQETR